MQNTTSGFSRFTTRGISGSRREVGGRVRAHGRSGSSSSWRSSSMSIVSGTSRPRPPVMPGRVAADPVVPSVAPDVPAVDDEPHATATPVTAAICSAASRGVS